MLCRFFHILMLTFATTCMVVTHTAVALPPILFLSMNGDASDASENALNGQIRGGVDWTQGRSDQALLLSGKGAIVTPQSTALHLGHESWTVSVWIRPDQHAGPHATILAWAPGLGRQCELRIHDNRRLEFLCGADEQHRAQATTDDLSDILFDGAWHQVVAVLDRARRGEMRIYLDDQPVTVQQVNMPYAISRESGLMTAVIGAKAPWLVGRKSGYHGAIDDVHIWRGVPKQFTGPADTALPPAPIERPAPRQAGLTPASPESRATHTLAPAETVIVTPSRSPYKSELESANLLQTWLRRAYQQQEGFEIVDDLAQLNGRFALAIGNTRYRHESDSAGRDGFVIRRKGNVLVLAGDSPRSSKYATMYMLDRFLGVRFYMPGALFTSTPNVREVIIGPLDIKEEPYVKSCTATGFHSLGHEATRWATDNALLRRHGPSHQHSMYERLPPARYSEKHPEIYPIIRGKRHIPKSRKDRLWQPCFTEPKLVDCAVDSALRFFAQHPSADYVSFSVEDGHQFCECARCHAATAPYADAPNSTAAQRRIWAKRRNHSAPYWHFLNQVAERLDKTLPEHGVEERKLVVGLVYSDVRSAPPFELHPNVLTWFVFKLSDLIIDKRLDSDANGNTRMTPWLSVSNNIGHHDWAQGDGFFIPRLYTGLASRFFREMSPHRLSYIHTEGYPNWGLDGPKLWIHSRIWWNPNVDVNGLWQSFCSDMFGPASASMLAYFTGLEQLWIDLNNQQERKLNRWHTQFISTPEHRATIAKLRGHLDNAAAEVATAEERARVDLFSKSFRLTEMLVDLAARETLTDAEVDPVRTYVKNTLAPDPMTMYRQGIGDAGSRFLNKTFDRCLKRLIKSKAAKPHRKIGKTNAQ